MKAYEVQLSTGSYDSATDYAIGYYTSKARAENTRSLLEHILSRLPKPASSYKEHDDAYYAQIEKVRVDLNTTLNTDIYYLDASYSTWLFEIEIQEGE